MASIESVSSQMQGEKFNHQTQESSQSINMINHIALLALGGLLTLYFVSRRYRINYTPLIQKCYRWLFSSDFNQQLRLYERVLSQSKKKINTQTPLQKSTDYQQVRKRLSLTIEASKKLVNEIFAEYLKKGNLLELGSNRLDENGNSYLSGLIEQHYKKRFYFSDYLPEVVAEEKKRNSHYLHVDATELKNLTFQAHIVAVNVIDTISREKLQDVAAGAHSILDKGQKIVILSDLHFHQDPLFEKYSTPDNIVFPYCKGNSLGIKIVSKEILLRHATDRVGPEFTDFIHSLMEEPLKVRIGFFMQMFAADKRFYELLEGLCSPEEYITIDNTESYLNDLKKTFEAHGGFRIIKNNFEERHVISTNISSEDPSINTLTMDLRIPHMMKTSFTLKLKEPQMRVGSVFHVFIAEKTGK